jgi:hypothetical protein
MIFNRYLQIQNIRINYHRDNIKLKHIKPFIMKKKNISTQTTLFKSLQF